MGFPTGRTSQGIDRALRETADGLRQQGQSRKRLIRPSGRCLTIPDESREQGQQVQLPPAKNTVTHVTRKAQPLKVASTTSDGNEVLTEGLMEKPIIAVIA